MMYVLVHEGNHYGGGTEKGCQFLKTVERMRLILSLGTYLQHHVSIYVHSKSLIAILINLFVNRVASQQQKSLLNLIPLNALLGETNKLYE